MLFKKINKVTFTLKNYRGVEISSFFTYEEGTMKEEEVALKKLNIIQELFSASLQAGNKTRIIEEKVGFSYVEASDDDVFIEEDFQRVKNIIKHSTGVTEDAFVKEVIKKIFENGMSDEDYQKKEDAEDFLSDLLITRTVKAMLDLKKEKGAK